ncbi:MAG: hypothetical protein J6A94_02725 [Lachnospiraceae bacterium]|nr:hypothetical protein [Lachnospiraceae bacterium]
MIFKCKNCEGNVVYSPEKHGMFCPFCDSEGSEERKDFAEGELQICPNCGGEVPVKEHTSATQCPYCDNYLIFNERVEGEFEPDLVIPFQLGKEKCKELIREKFKKCLFAPSDFLSEVRLNSMEGDYVPFWFYDYDVNCDFQAEGTKVRSWTSGDTQYTETSYYNIVRNMNVDFKKIPVDASVGMPDDVMDLLEPYNYDMLEHFKPEYLSGFEGEKYNMVSDVVEPRAKQKMTEDVEQMLKSSYAGYATVRTQHKNIKELGKAVNYGLLPVWKYIYTYQDKEYPFYVNGQNGKIVGTAPISTKKVWAYAGTLWACLAFIMTMLSIIAL